MNSRQRVPRLLRSKLLIASIGLGLLPGLCLAQPGAASSDAALQTDLRKALARSMDSGEAIRAFVRAGVVNQKPNTRMDYTDYYVVDKPFKFLGHDLQMIEQEYMAAYVGCCVSPGMGITVRLHGSADKLHALAAQSKCRFKDDSSDFKDVMKYLKLRPQAGRYATISCRERDR